MKNLSVAKKNNIWTDDEIEGKIKYDNNTKKIEQKNTWHKLLESPKWILMNPAEEVIQFYDKYLGNPTRQYRARNPHTMKKIHDLGCGGGRHVYYFAELGFDVTGSDISTNAIEFTRKELKRREQKANLVLCPMTEFPFKDSAFDVTISRATIFHASLQNLKKSIHEIARTTKPGGLFFATFVSERSSEWKVGKEVVKDMTYIPTKGPEKGLIHTYLSVANLAALIEPFFCIEEIYLNEHPPLIKAPNAMEEYFSSEYVVIGVRR